MARKRKPEIQERELHGFKHFKLLMPVLEKLHDTACARDTAGNRLLHFDQYAALEIGGLEIGAEIGGNRGTPYLFP